MKTPFSKAFARLRQQAGFDTAYQFYHKSGGRKVFQCSFQNYLRIENGAHLPQPQRLPLLCTLLRLPLGSEDLRQLVTSYLDTWFKSSELAEWMLRPFRSVEPAAPPPDPARQALQKLVRESAKPVSVAQYQAIMSSAAAYWCYRVLTTDHGCRQPQDLAKLLGLPPGEVAKGLKALVEEGIAKRRKDGSYESPLAGQFLMFPESSLIKAEVMNRVFKYNADMVKRKGALVDVRYCGVRADAGQLQGYIPHLREAVRGINAYAVDRKTDRSGLFFVETKLYKLLDF